MQKQTLNGLWKMQETDGGRSYPVTVPGTVLSCLLAEKAIEDPY